MIVRMVLHVVKFVNGFPRKGGVKLYSPGEIMSGRRLYADDLQLAFGTYCQVAKHVEHCNSIAPQTWVAIPLGTSGNLSGGQTFLALNTCHTIIRHQWVVLPMPPAVIARVTVLGKAEPSILTSCHAHLCNWCTGEPWFFCSGGHTQCLCPDDCERQRCQPLKNKILIWQNKFP